MIINIFPGLSDMGKKMDNEIEDTNNEVKLLEEITIKTRMSRITKHLEKITKVDIWNYVAKYVIPTIGILFFIVYFTVGYFIQFNQKYND